MYEFISSKKRRKNGILPVFRPRRSAAFALEAKDIVAADAFVEPVADVEPIHRLGKNLGLV